MSAVQNVLKPIKGLVALVTGGASGLGRGTAEYLHRSGAKVAVLDIPQSEGGEFVKELGENAIFTPANVTSQEQIESAVNSIKSNFGRLDAVINCAGIAYAFKIYNLTRKEMSPIDKIQKTIDVNLIGTINVIRHATGLMLENEKDEANQRGIIINTASIAAFDGQIGQTAYAASKGGIVSMTLPLARDLSDSGIRVMTIAPGLFDTPLLQSLPNKVRVFLNQLVPNPQRLGKPDEFAALVEHCIQNPYINGEVIRLDGALRMPP